MLATDDEFDQWIDGSADEVYALARPYPAEVMHIVCKGENCQSRSKIPQFPGEILGSLPSALSRVLPR